MLALKRLAQGCFNIEKCSRARFFLWGIPVKQFYSEHTPPILDLCQQFYRVPTHLYEGCANNSIGSTFYSGSITEKMAVVLLHFVLPVLLSYGSTCVPPVLGC